MNLRYDTGYSMNTKYNIVEIVYYLYEKDTNNIIQTEDYTKIHHKYNREQMVAPLSHR